MARLRILFGPADLNAAASAEHAGVVLVTMRLHPHAAVSGDRCNAVLHVSAAGEDDPLEPTRIEGRTAHYVVPRERFASYGPRTPLVLTLCGVELRVSGQALRALRHFIELEASLR